MNTTIRRLGGKISGWLLARPSSRSVGQLNIPIAFVICILLAVISLGFVFAQWLATERLHTLLKDREVQLTQSLNFSQEMSTCLANAHRSTLNVLLAREVDEFAEANDKRISNLNRFGELLQAQGTGNALDLPNQKQELATWFKEYRRLSAQVVGLAQEGRTEEALALRVEKLRPVFDSWQKSQEKFGISINLQNSRNQEEYLQAIAATRVLLAALFVIPALLVVGGVFALIAVIGFHHFRGRYADPEDTWAH